MSDDSNIFLKAYLDSVNGPDELEALESRLNLPNTDELKFITEGGAKKIYLSYAQHEEREVVIAMPKSPDFAEAFIREAEIHSRLEHSNIIPLYNLGMLDGTPYFSMKYVRGSSLTDYAKKHLHNAINNPLTFDRVLEFFLKICEAVRYAHKKNTLHLDIKPDNILISTGEEVYLSDWGLARRRNDSDAEDIEVTETPSGQFTYYGYLKGTPGYMAPEQCVKGANKSVHTDIYSLGALLIFLLTGAPPVKGSAESMIQSTKEGQLDYDESLIPQRLRRLAKKLLERHPQNRHSSVTEIIDDIHAFRSGHLTSADDRSTWQLLGAVYRRNKLATWSIASAIVITITLTSLGFQRINQAKTAAILSHEATLKSHAEKRALEDAAAQQRLEMSREFINRSQEYNARPDRGYTSSLFRDNEISYQNICFATELNPDSYGAWHVRGTLEILAFNFHEAVESLSQAGPRAMALLELCKNYTDEEISDDQTLIILIKDIYDLRTESRLYHDLCYKRIFTPKDITSDLDMAMKMLAIRHNVDEHQYDFDLESMSLTVTDDQDFTFLFTLKNIPLRHLNLANTMVRNDLRHCIAMPILTLNLKNTQARSHDLEFLKGKAIRELNISGCSVDSLTFIADTPLEKIDISYLDIKDYSTLKSLRHMKLLTISQDQEQHIAALALPASVLVKVIDQPETES